MTPQNTDQTEALQEYYSFFAHDIGDLSIESNMRKYIEACVTLQGYVKAGMTLEDAWFETCFDLDI